MIFGSNSRRYKDIFDLFYLKDIVNKSRVNDTIRFLIVFDDGMRENNYEDIVKRVNTAFNDKQYLKRVSGSKQRWIDEKIETIAQGIISFLMNLQEQE